MAGGLGIQTIAFALITCPVSMFVYRLLLHPLAAFPGPKTAAETYWWEFYRDWFKDGGGQFCFELDRLHAFCGEMHRDNEKFAVAHAPKGLLYVSHLTSFISKTPAFLKYFSLRLHK